MKKLILIIIVFSTLQVFSQTQIGTGNSRMQITYRFSSFANYRSGWDSAYLDRKQNKLFLRNAQLLLKGTFGKNTEFDFGLDGAQLISKANDPQNPALVDANLTYKGLGFVDLILGYGKVPYSRNNFVSFFESPFWQRPEIVGGAFFSRRDVGVSFHKSLLRNTINLFGGVYNGLGESSLLGLNDPSGKFEYISRVEYSYPSRYRYKEIDERISVIPMFSIGVNGRYTNKVLPVGENFAALTQGEFLTKVISGEKYTYGADAAFQYRGISAQFEIHQLRMQPSDSTSLLYNKISKSKAGGKILSGGFFGQLNYYNLKARSTVSVRYEELNMNDLVPGYFARWGFAYSYQIKGFNSLLKAQYFYNQKEESLIDNLNHKHQFRVGIQIII